MYNIYIVYHVSLCNPPIDNTLIIMYNIVTGTGKRQAESEVSRMTSKVWATLDRKTKLQLFAAYIAKLKAAMR